MCVQVRGEFSKCSSTTNRDLKDDDAAVVDSTYTDYKVGYWGDNCNDRDKAG